MYEPFELGVSITAIDLTIARHPEQNEGSPECQEIPRFARDAPWMTGKGLSQWRGHEH